MGKKFAVFTKTQAQVPRLAHPPASVTPRRDFVRSSPFMGEDPALKSAFLCSEFGARFLARASALQLSAMGLD